MADRFLETDELLEAVAEAEFDRAPAVVANAHITGLSVARALSAHGIPVIAVDRSGDGVAPPSNAIDYAGRITYPLDDREGFRTDLEALADAAGTDLVAFGCMDEWVHAFADVEADGVRRPFSDKQGIDAVLDKSSLYRLAEELEVPYPETYWLSESDPDAAAEALGFPFVLKPALKREGEEALGTNVVEVSDREQLYETLEAAEAADVELLAQEKVNIAQGKDTSLASYISPDGETLSVVGNARVRYPQSFGTSCVVETTDRPEIRERALSVLDRTGYHGISESEFVYDADREEYVLLDINTRPWKWISMPVAAGANLPLAAYASVVDSVEYDVSSAAENVGDARWVYLRDYLTLLSTDDSFRDVLSGDDWTTLVSGGFESAESLGTSESLTTGVYRPSDPNPTAKLLETEFSRRDYYCSC
ncbi:carboxylate--amine ligase [Haloprofundus marisrubri]|uniref:Carboxylate--amine ligase n=1 Tax=Haloprofundus marisrubri TaxID=1514971 RepID=A0A0W1R7G9_9EURY|nr:carboxylate--amine ligase [Haloprofundus marisrubri]KTG09148.1 carboxylate--amine ligase [Haloprofundus marisrubri]